MGTVKDLLVDADARTVVALVLGGGKRDLGLPYSAIRTIGPDAVMIDNSSVAGEPDSIFPQSRRFSDLTRVQVLTTAGVAWGNVSDLGWTVMSGAINEVDFKSGGVLGIGGQRSSLGISAVKSIGPDAITVEPEMSNGG